MPKYNGHHCWNCWNVALWIANDEPMYRDALDCLRRPKANGQQPSLAVATNRFLDLYSGKTPDGAKYTFKSVRSALEGLE